jgi:nucleotide-binding universal stress UspA family protein
MKTTLILTDFSDNATHAAEFGYQFAKQVNSNIILCNAFAAPVEMPQGNLVVWPMYAYDEIAQSCAGEERKLKEKLESHNNEGFEPEIKCINEAGAINDVIAEVVNTHDIGLIVMGTQVKDGVSSFILGDHCKRMIDSTARPLLLVPPSAKTCTVKKIAFATDLENIGADVDAVFELITYAKELNAEILLTFVDNDTYDSSHVKAKMNELWTILWNRADYPLISNKLIQSYSLGSGLEWLCEHEKVDILAMVHRTHNFFVAAIQGSHTKKIAGHLTKPLLVFKNRPKSE